MRTLWKYATILSLALLFFSCEKEKSGLLDPSQSSPYIVSATVEPSRLNLDSLSNHVDSLGNRNYRLTVSLAGLALNAGGDAIGSVSYKLTPSGGSAAIQQGTVSLNRSADTTQFTGSLSFTVSRNDIGVYLLDLVAKNSTGATSNAVTLSLTVSRTNHPPVLSNLVAPDSVQRPPAGQTRHLLFSVAASDPDGDEDISSVVFKRVSPGESPYVVLFDDGDRTVHGDSVQGDGIFSNIVSINSTNTLGDKIFLFQAFDQMGAVSDSLTHRVTITP